MLLFLKVTCGLGARVNPPLLSWSLLMPGLKSVLSEYGLALKVSAEICRFSGLTYKAMAVGHQQGVYLYWTTVMWLGDRKNLVLLLISWDAKCCLNLVWFEFSHRTLKLSDRTYAKLSLWTMLTQSNYSSPQLSSDPQAWGVILVLFRPTHLKETAHSDMWPLQSRWNPLLSLLLRYTTCKCV